MRRPDLVRTIYLSLIALYPKGFRDRFEADLRQAFDDRRVEERFSGPWGGVRLVCFLFRDFVTSLPLAYRDDQTNRMGMMMGELLRDLRFSVRMLVKDPVFTFTAVLTLALGIGLNAATFSAVDGILLQPLSGVERPDALVQVYRAWPGIEFGSNSIPHYQDLRDRGSDVFENLSAQQFAPMSLSADGRSERIMGMVVSANFFQTFGVQPALGRAFLPGVEDDGPGAHPVAVLGHGFWQSRFGGRADIVGTTVELNGHPFEVVGVAPADFNGPVNFADIPVYVPLMMLPVIEPGGNRLEARGMNAHMVVGRLHDGITLAQAEERFDAILSQLKEEFPRFYEGQLGTRFVFQNDAGFHPSFAGAQKGMSAVMMAVVGLLLLIACVNVANLFLARARDRRREMGIRLSLGAGRGRVVRQLLTESLLFSALAGATGLILAGFATRFLSTIRPPMDGPWHFDISLNETVLWYTLAISLATGFVFGMVPALQAARPNMAAAIKGESDRAGGRSRASSLLVVAQMALSLLLLVSSGLFLRSLQGATKIDPGFDTPRNLVMASLDPGLQGYDEASTREFYDRIRTDLASQPGVVGVAITNTPPLGLSNSDRSVAIPGYEFAEGELSSLLYSYVSDGYLETMGTELLEGRDFSPLDNADAAPVIIVNKRFADRFWPGQSALGKTVQTAGAERTVVGVVETGKYRSLGEDPTEFMYMSQAERFSSSMTLVARAHGDPQEVLRQIRSVVRNADQNMPLYDVRTMDDHMGIALLPARLGGTVLGLFGLLGLGLASVGIYGVMAYSVAQRRRELGIRVALGADRRSVVQMVLGEGLRLAVGGALVGLLGALFAAQLVKGLLYNVAPIDPVAFTVVPALLIGVAAMAVYIPARRAAGLDPMRALKAE